MILNQTIYFIACFTSSYLITFLSIKPIIFYGLKYSLIDIPNERKQHKTIKVRIGGLSIFVSFLITTILANFLVSFFEIYSIDIKTINIFLLLSLLFFLIGFLDDILNLSPFSRLIAQSFAAILTYLSGFSIDKISFPSLITNSSEISFTPLLSLFLTIWWIVGTTNAINWIDGIDGLAAGITAIAAIGFTCLNISIGNISTSILSITLAGACIGYLYFNLYPSRILMGDGGSYFLGFSLALIAILTANEKNNFELISSLFILFVPLFDMFLVILQRLIKLKSPFFPDQNHIHHKLIKLGYSQPKTVLLIFSFSTIITIITIVLTSEEVKPALGIVIFTMTFTIFTLLIRKIRNKRKKFYITS